MALNRPAKYFLRRLWKVGSFSIVIAHFSLSSARTDGRSSGCTSTCLPSSGSALSLSCSQAAAALEDCSSADLTGGPEGLAEGAWPFFNPEDKEEEELAEKEEEGAGEVEDESADSEDGSACPYRIVYIIYM